MRQLSCAPDQAISSDVDFGGGVAKLTAGNANLTALISNAVDNPGGIGQGTSTTPVDLASYP